MKDLEFKLHKYGLCLAKEQIAEALSFAGTYIERNNYAGLVRNYQIKLLCEYLESLQDQYRFEKGYKVTYNDKQG